MADVKKLWLCNTNGVDIFFLSLNIYISTSWPNFLWNFLRKLVDRISNIKWYVIFLNQIENHGNRIYIEIDEILQ